eukprot:COSAG02_NODE_821_length_16794_cov_42.795747_16_plen_114_part_00
MYLGSQSGGFSRVGVLIREAKHQGQICGRLQVVLYLGPNGGGAHRGVPTNGVSRITGSATKPTVLVLVSRYGTAVQCSWHRLKSKFPRRLKICINETQPGHPSSHRTGHTYYR